LCFCLISSTDPSPTGISLCYALSRKPRFKLARWWQIAVKAAAVPVALALATATWAQSSTPQRKPQVTKSLSTKKQLSPEEQLWCPILKSALSGAEAAEPPMRSYLLDAVAGGLSKCAPQQVRSALIGSFTATLSMPESQEEVDQRERRFHLAREQPDEATQESLFNLQMKETLQRSALSHLLTIDEAKVDSLLPQAEPEVRAGLMRAMISQATSAKKFDRALELLSRTPSKDWFSHEFPFREATQLMLDLPPEREGDKQELFRVAMTADREQRIFTTSGDDLASMIVRFWRHVPPALALDAIHQVLDRAYFEMGLTLSTPSGSVGFSNERDYRLFELLPILRELDNDEADKLLQSSQQAQLGLKQFPNGMQSIDPSIGDTLPKGEPVHNLGPSMADTGGSVSYGPDARVQEIVRMAEDNPRKAIAAAATLPETVGSPDWPFDFPRAEAYLGIARALMEKNPSAASDALEQMAESLKHIAHTYQTMGQWLEGITIARKIDQVDLALKLFRLGMEQADRLRSEDADPDDPNIATKAFWPSVCVYSGLVLAAAQISPQTALEHVREIKDPEILLLLEVKLARKKLGASALQSSAMVHKKTSHAGMYGSCAD
jgi:hypothetical protein